MMLYNELKSLVGESNITTKEPMSKHTTFKVGGVAEYFVTPPSLQSLSNVIKKLSEEKIEYYLLGNGSNVIVRDGGYKGIIIKIGEGFENIEINLDEDGNGMLRVGAGVLLSKAAKVAAENELTGMETLAGIPGSVGGAVVMNAGAYGGEIKDVLLSVNLMDCNGDIFELSADKLDLSYRHSIVEENKYIVLEAVFKLCKGKKEEIKEKMMQLSIARREKQPLEYPSAGSTFKRPEGYFAGKLIMDSGLSGFRVGDAMVSKKHCGFVVNVGEATASEVLAVIEGVKEKVKSEFDVELEAEVKIIGME